MASQISRQASSLLSRSVRPRSLQLALPNRQFLRCAHEQASAQASETEKPKYERQTTTLPYTHKGFCNGRPQPRAPFGTRARKPFRINDDPRVLDAMYLKLFGKDMGLTTEAKWQAVTHKTFDHGRQPFNSKLRFLGASSHLSQLEHIFDVLTRVQARESLRWRPQSTCWRSPSRRLPSPLRSTSLLRAKGS